LSGTMSGLAAEIEREFISQRTSGALARCKAAGKAHRLFLILKNLLFGCPDCGVVKSISYVVILKF